ncbi:MAG: glycosyltransferase [Anaerolineaceae bacterium]|nr:glycosyltransferase [Anaerolineaceae bacterium]
MNATTPGPQRPTIAILLPDLRMGGAERVSLILAGGFVQAGYPVDLVLIKGAGQLLAEVPAGVRQVELGCASEYTALRPLMNYLEQRRPAVAISSLDLASCVLLLARRLSGVDTMTTVVESSTVSIFRRSTAKKLMERLLLSALFPTANFRVGVSKNTARDLAAYIGLPAGQVKAIYNPIIHRDLPRLAAEPVEHPWFVPGQPPVVLAVGRLRPEKDYATLLRAFRLVQAQRDCRLVILGDGELRPELESLVQELGLQARVSLPGFAGNPYAYMSRAGVFVLSSSFEGLPSVLVQAMACGCPVVSTNCPSGPDEILEGGRYGHLVPVGDVEAIAAAVLDVLDGRGKPVPAGWLQQFEIETIIEQYLEMFGLPQPDRES